MSPSPKVGSLVSSSCLFLSDENLLCPAPTLFMRDERVFGRMLSLILHNHRHKIVIAGHFSMVAFSVLVFHVPDVARPNIAHLAIACCYPDCTRQAYQLLGNRSGVDRLIPSPLKPEKHHLLDLFRFGNLNGLSRWCKCAHLKPDIDIRPMAFTFSVRIKLLIFHTVPLSSSKHQAFYRALKMSSSCSLPTFPVSAIARGISLVKDSN